MHQDDSAFQHDMHHEDKLVIFKLNDMLHPIAGRLRQFVNKGRFTDPDYVYIHRGDGTILQKYTHGFTILKEITLG